MEMATKLDKFLFHVFVRISGLGPEQNTSLFEKITNQILRLNLQTRGKRKQNIVLGHGQFNIILAFVGFKGTTKTRIQL